MPTTTKQPIPGTTIFDGEQAQKGYALNNCDNGTYIARYDELVTGREEPVDVSRVAVSGNGIELQDREFIAAISEGREPNASIASVLGCYRVLGELEAQLSGQR
jgi:2-hydroxy-4-carboxymuconate semialdehyde hemiacetal dehydrogenase